MKWTDWEKKDKRQRNAEGLVRASGGYDRGECLVSTGPTTGD